MPAPRRRWPRVLAIGCLTPVVVLVVAGAVLAVWKPWAPKVVVDDPGSSGRRVTADGLLANFYPAPGQTKAPGVLVLGGSEGGISSGVSSQAKSLQKEGFSVLALSYWGGPGQPRAMDGLPLETFRTALDYLGSRPEVDKTRLAVVGTSKGAEAALLVATREPSVRAVVGLVPSSVVWQGINQAEPWKMSSIGSTWSADGKQVPYLPYGKTSSFTDRYGAFANGLKTLDQHPDAVIPIEKTTAPVLLVCGEADSLWPSCAMADQIANRASRAQQVSVLKNPGAGHFGVGAPVEEGSPDYSKLGDLGGTVEANAQARKTSWPKVVAFLRDSLRFS